MDQEDKIRIIKIHQDRWNLSAIALISVLGMIFIFVWKEYELQKSQEELLKVHRDLSHESVLNRKMADLLQRVNDELKEKNAENKVYGQLLGEQIRMGLVEGHTMLFMYKSVGHVMKILRQIKKQGGKVEGIEKRIEELVLGHETR